MFEQISEDLAQIIADTTTANYDIVHSFINLLFVVVALFIALRVTEYLVLRYIRKRNKSEAHEAKLNTITRMLDGFFKFITFFFILIQVLIAFNVDKAQIITVLGTFSVALGFALQGIIKDLINGVIFVVEDQYKLGDFIEVNKEYKGTVEKLTMRVTQLRDADGALHIIPNSTIIEVTTFSKEFVKAIIIVSTEYGADTEWVIKKIEEEMKIAYDDLSEKMMATPEVLGISAFRDSSIDIKIICDTAVGEKFAVEYELRLRIKKMFDREGIVMPFPQRDVNLINTKN